MNIASVRPALLLLALLSGACGSDDSGAASDGGDGATDGADGTADGGDGAADGATDGADGAGDGADGTATGDCDDFDPNRRAFFGDTHVHTSWSFDSYVLGNYANDPATAYRFAKGEEVPKPPFEDDGVTPVDGRTIRLRAPLDFIAVTDHAEFFAEVDYCVTPPDGLTECGAGDAARYIYCSQECRLFRSTGLIDDVAGIDLAFMEWAGYLTSDPATRNPQICDEDENGVSEEIDCLAHSAEIWQAAQAITEAAHDPCTFTAMHGYEWSRAEGDAAAMLHRNILFRSDAVVDTPITTFEASDPYTMLATTRDACASVEGCEFLAIPHNSNLSYGLTFQVEDAEDGLLLTEEHARLRATHEPIIELIQAKGSSECRNGLERYAAAYDEFCEFEVMIALPMCSEPDADPDNCLLECDPTRPNTSVDPDESGEGGVEGCQASTDFLRNSMKEGLVQQERLGFNPFKLGFVGSTDTHDGTPGAVAEETFQGSHASLDDEPAEHVDFDASIFANIENPGGLAVVWAEENTRASIFDAMMRKETYATSGTRITHRFFGAWDLPEGLCDDPDLVEKAYEAGVAMGGTLEGGAGAAPTFLAWAARAPDLTDPDGASWPGTPLQRIQIIKVWTDAAGAAHEAVYDVTDDPDNGATVNPATCEISRTGADELCAVWTDPDFDTTVRASYYTRVIEDPTCRWSQHVCNETRGQWDCSDPEGEDYWEGCCDADLPKVVQERAWASPIWVDPS